MLKTFTTFSDFLITMNKRKKIWWKLTEDRKQDFDKKKKSFLMKKDYEREQERNDKYFFYQNRYTRFEGPRDRDRETMNSNFLQFRMNQADEYNFRSNFQSNVYSSLSMLFWASTPYNAYEQKWNTYSL